MNDATQRIIQKCEQYWNEHSIGDVEIHAVLEAIHTDAHEATTLIESQDAEIERLRKLGHRLELALMSIDIAIMSDAQREADTKAVGGPVSFYGFDYDEQGVVQRVQAFVESQALSARERRFLANYLRIPKEEQHDA